MQIPHNLRKYVRTYVHMLSDRRLCFDNAVVTLCAVPTVNGTTAKCGPHCGPEYLSVDIHSSPVMHVCTWQGALLRLVCVSRLPTPCIPAFVEQPCVTTRRPVLTHTGRVLQNWMTCSSTVVC